MLLTVVFFLHGKSHVSTLIVIEDVIKKRMQHSRLNVLEADSGVKGQRRGAMQSTAYV